ncbi:MAG: hypothetical protein M0P54_01795 [Bacteroidales bacterium]|nr:hypothetical protein [Bacteroidales bacterium]MDY0369013.1 hypothetical protein [Bacteroidales bacterium]
MELKQSGGFDRAQPPLSSVTIDYQSLYLKLKQSGGFDRAQPPLSSVTIDSQSRYILNILAVFASMIKIKLQQRIP